MVEKNESVVAEILNDIRSYTRIAAAASSRPTAVRVLDSYEKARVYSLMDGKTSTYKISESAGVPQRTIAAWADEFVKSNMAVAPDDFHASHKSLFSLSELAIDLSSLKRKRKEEKTSPPATSGTQVEKTEEA
ncbi:MAG: hypothetical protein M1587_08955, partial [Thaumarchaeota archaeon]|nr:hypothetical protein [Nitrososphaerota archaeon]